MKNIVARSAVLFCMVIGMSISFFGKCIGDLFFEKSP